MALQCGIVGLPNVGKSTLFNALTESNIPAENYPFCTIDPHQGIIHLPDSRLQKLNTIYNPKKLTPANVEFTDIAGIVKGASKGEGLGNQFLSQIRQTSAILHVVRCFENQKVNHINETVDPIRDVETIETELLLADLQTLEKRKQKLEKDAKSNQKEKKNHLILINELTQHCSSGKKVNLFKVDDNMRSFKNSLHLLTDKPTLYIANIDESDLINKKINGHVKTLKEFVENQNCSLISLCASLEQEIASIKQEEKLLYLSEYNLSESGLNKVIRASFILLGLQTFFTCGKNEVRAWTTLKGTTAPQAAGKIHSDFERGFIKAEVFHYNEIVKYKKEKILRELGMIRQEGRDYIIKDGDCVFFKFNV